MALTKEERDSRIKINQILDRYSEDIKNIFDDVSTFHVNEGVGTKISSIAELQKLMNDNRERLAFLGSNQFNEGAGTGGYGVEVSIFLMSTKTVKVPDSDNLISIGYDMHRSEGTVNYTYVRDSSHSSTSLENFMELPITPDVDNAISASDLVRRCDSSQFYKLYQEDALALMRKMFPYPYGMFTGPHLYKREERVKGNTLYVAYDKFRKKFRYSYNPDFILECAIEEWMLNRSKYKSLKDCYCYLLAFMITHEMLHIIHHNTVAADMGIDESRLSTSDHSVANAVMDSFINCKIARRFSGAPQLNTGRDIAPMLSNGVGSKMSVRIEHNKGLKKFNNLKELADEVTKVVTKYVKLPNDDNTVYYYDKERLVNRDLSKYEGADLFISVDITPTLNELRSEGTNLFQNCFNDIIKAITDGRAHDMYSKISDSEKLSDLDVLPVGTLVMVKGERDLGYVREMDESGKKYGINRAVVSGEKILKSNENGDLYVTEYSDSGSDLGTFSRINIRPYNPEEDAYYKNVPDNKQDKLSPEDLQELQQAEQGQQNQQGDMPNMSGGNTKQPKALKVGDIVWVRKVKKFGRIVSIDNGKFNIEEVIEKPCKVLDDSDNYN